MIRRDAYFPYAFAEIAALVLPDVAAKLDPDKRYGIWWSTRHDVKVVERVRTAEGKYTDRRTYGVKPREEWIAVPIPNAEIPQEVVERARRNIEHNFRPASKGRRGWELTGGLLYCGECGRKMVGHSVAPSGRKPYHYYVCPRKVEESWQIYQNKAHSAEALEERVRDAVMRLLTEVERTERLIEERIEREREAMRDPDREALWWAKRLEEIDGERKQSQKMAARGLMDLDVLDELLDELDEERRAAQKELEAARGLKGRIEELENDRGIMLALYAGYASVDLTAFPPEERRRIYATLGLKIRAYKDKRTEIIISDPTADYFPPEEDEPRQLVERIIYNTERIKEREEQQARLAKKLNEGVMSCGELS